MIHTSCWPVIGLWALLLAGCKSPSPPKKEPAFPPLVESKQPVPDYDTTSWTELTPGDQLIIELRYATSNNFVKTPIYPCGRCFLRPDVAAALKKVNQEIRSTGYQLKLFDCYRPTPAQQVLWDKVPNPDYVAPPAKGSMHSRGFAIDLTLADLQGHDINMGTTYDFFGPEAHQDYLDLPQAVLANRKLLRQAMEKAGFHAIRTEWWHFSYGQGMPPLMDWQWACPGKTN